MELLIGADVEMFVNDGKDFLPAYGLVPGTKARPHAVPKGMVQVDGMAVEFGIDPAKNSSEFVNNLSSVRKTMATMLKKHGNTIVPVVQPTVEFNRTIFDKAPPIAKELGCEPDFNAYNNGEANPRPDAGDAPIRTAGGHVHIGWTSGVDTTDLTHIEACCMLTKMLDLYLGLPSIFWDNDQKRRSLYGQAGAFRPKPYGMEYRTLSCAWLKHPTLVRYVYQSTSKAFNRLMSGHVDYYNNEDGVQRLINEGVENQKQRAFGILSRFDHLPPKAPKKRNF